MSENLQSFYLVIMIMHIKVVNTKRVRKDQEEFNWKMYPFKYILNFCCCFQFVPAAAVTKIL